MEAIDEKATQESGNASNQSGLMRPLLDGPGGCAVARNHVFDCVRHLVGDVAETILHSIDVFGDLILGASPESAHVSEPAARV